MEQSPSDKGALQADLDRFVRGELTEDMPEWQSIMEELGRDPNGSAWKYVEENFREGLRKWSENLPGVPLVENIEMVRKRLKKLGIRRNKTRGQDNSQQG